jgi:hypothetical protein
LRAQAATAVALTVASIVLVGLVWQTSPSNPGTSARSGTASPTSEAARLVTREVTVVVTPSPTPLSYRDLTGTAQPTRTAIPFLTRVRATPTKAPTSWFNRSDQTLRVESDRE